MSISKLKAELQKMQEFDEKSVYEEWKFWADKQNAVTFAKEFIEGARFENTKSARMAEMLLEAIEAWDFYADRENWIFTKSLPSPHSGSVRMTIVEDDTEIGLLCNGQHDDVAGKKAREFLNKLAKGAEK